MHLNNPRQGLAELWRVTKPGGCVVVLDGDFDTLILAADNRLVTEKILRMMRRHFENDWIGRELSALFRDVGLTDILVVPETLILTGYALADHIWRIRETVDQAVARGTVTAEEGTTWLHDLAQRSQTGRFFNAITGFSVKGRKPL